MLSHIVNLTQIGIFKSGDTVCAKTLQRHYFAPGMHELLTMPAV